MTTPISSGPQGHVVSGSGNISHALVSICDYNNSYNNLQASLTQLLSTLSTASANLTTQFQAEQNAAGSVTSGDNPTITGGLLWQMTHVTAANFTGSNGQSNFSAWMSKTQSAYQAAVAANSAQVKQIDTQSSQVQNIMSQLPQQSQNNIQLMGTIVGWTQNLAKLLSN